jgi:DNA repair exonuclease SbcCD ATPase subunit
MNQNYEIDKTFTYLFHISDIHIQNNVDRQNEFKLQFNKLFDIIKSHKNYKQKKNQCIIVVTGDILDQSFKVSAVAIDLVNDFMDGLCNLAPTIVIPGNHDDKKPVGTSTLNSLTAILAQESRPRNNLHYLKDSGIYKFGTNLAFGHTSVVGYDKKKPNVINPKDISNNFKKIALFHGCDLSHNHFNGYDLVLLGDIHHVKSIGSDNMWYAGSLIQKGYGEDRKLHGGLLIWDINSNQKPEYIHIENQHEFITLNIIDGNIDGEFRQEMSQFEGELRKIEKNEKFNPNSLPIEISIRLKCCNNTTPKQINILVEQLKTKCNVKNVLQYWNSKTSDNILDNSTEIISPTQQLENYIHSNPNYKDHKTQLIEIFNELQDDKVESNIDGGKWDIKSIEFKNIFNWNGEHLIDFDTFPQDIISISGDNASGKSNLINIILIAIYGLGKGDRYTLTENCSSGYTKIIIQLNDNIYTIKRQYKNKENKASRDGQDIILINEVDISPTGVKEYDSFINITFGEKDKLCNTNISKQGEHQNFINKNKTEKKQFIKKIIDTDEWDSINIKAKETITTLNKNLKDKKNEKKNIHILDIDDLNIQKRQLQENINKQEHQIETQRDKRKNNDINIFKKQSISQDILTLNDSIQQIQPNIKTIPISNKDINLEIDSSDIQKKNIQLQLDKTKLEIENKIEQKHNINISEDNFNIDDHINKSSLKKNQLETSISTKEKKLVIYISEKEDIDQNITKESDHNIQLQKDIDIITNEKELLLLEHQHNTTFKYNTIKDYEKYLSTNQIIQERINNTKDIISAKTNNINHIQNIDEIPDKYAHYNLQQLEKDTINKQISDKNQLIIQISKYIQEDRFEYDTTCSCCDNNSCINLIPQKKQQLELANNELTALSSQLSIIDEYLKDNITIISSYVTYNELQQLNDNLDVLKVQQSDYNKMNEERDLFIIFTKQKQQLQNIDDKRIKMQNDKRNVNKSLEVYSKKRDMHISNITTLENDMIMLKNELQNVKDKLQQLHHTKITFQQQLQFKKDNDILDIDISKLKENEMDLYKQIEVLKKRQDVLNQYIINYQQNEKLNLNIDNITCQINKKQLELSELHTIYDNNTIQQDIITIKNILEEYKTDYDGINTQIIKNNTNIQILNTIQQEIETYEYDLNIYQKFKELSDNYPVYLMEYGLVNFEILINRYLVNMTQFEIEIDKENIIFNKIIRSTDNNIISNIPIESCSGFEKFAISIAIRIAISKINPSCSMSSLIIDEGFGVFDTNNIKKLPNILEPLKDIFNRIFIITHIDELQNELKHKIKIYKKNGINCIIKI